jgi:flagellar basal-body rod modification protein FlgD
MTTTPVTSQGSPVAGQGTSDTVSRTDAGGAMGQDTFIKLLMTQMTHQDPLQPTDSAQMLSQLAQFSSVEGITKVNTQLTALNLSQDFASSVSMIGKTVAYLDDNGALHSGTVQSVKPSSRGAILSVDGVDIFSGQVSKVT